MRTLKATEITARILAAVPEYAPATYDPTATLDFTDLQETQLVLMHARSQYDRMIGQALVAADWTMGDRGELLRDIPVVEYATVVAAYLTEDAFRDATNRPIDCTGRYH